VKARIELENVGGIRGKVSFEIEQGKVNEVLAPNAMGKTSFVRGLAVVLSAPYRDEFIINEAINLGIKGERGSKWEELVNIYEEYARVVLSINSDKREYMVHKDGTVKKLPFGDERFLLAGLLTGECRTIRQLLTGDDKFNWIVNKLSLANFYEAFYKEVKRYKDSAERKRAEIERKIEIISNKLREKEELEKQRESISKSLEEIKKKLDREKQKLLEERKALINDINVLKEEIEKRKGEIRRIEKKKDYLEKQLEKIRNEIKKLEKEKKSINLEDIRKEVEKKRRELDDKINELKKLRDEYRGNVNLFQDVLLVMRRHKKEKTICPACRKSVLTIEEVEANITEYEEKVRQINSEITKLNIEKEKINQKVAGAERKIRELDRRIEDFHKEMKDIESNLRKIMAEMPVIKREIERNEKEIAKKARKLEELELKTKEEDEALNNELKKLERHLSEISEKIGSIKGFIEESSTEKVGSRWVDPSVANKIYLHWIAFLDSLADYLRQKIHEHREAARTKFNQRIKDLMIKLGFTEFDQIALTQDDYRLVVFRKGFVNQPIRTLSMSEKYAIATLLQITLKETYLPDIPFFIVDEVILSFDETRKKRILEYLAEQARRNNWFIIVTKLAEEEKGIVVKPLELVG